jgi:Uma2 family endonuclease
MATQPLDRYTIEQYVEMEDTLGYRSEFHDGIILPVESATPTHARLGARLGSLLNNSFPSCVYDSSLNVYIASSNKVLHPDATVLCGPANYPKPDCIDNPMVLVEITSPSTKDYDHGTKREYYFSLDSIQHYLLVSQAEKRVGHYERSGAGWIYVDRRSLAVILIGTVEIPIAAIYTGILDEPETKQSSAR